MWLDIDEEKMYSEARVLRDRQFQAREIAEHILKSYLEISFGDMTAEGSDVASHAYATIDDSNEDEDKDRFKIVIKIGAHNVWPLLAAYTTEEKTVASFGLASIILHELTVRPIEPSDRTSTIC